MHSSALIVALSASGALAAPGFFPFAGKGGNSQQNNQQMGSAQMSTGAATGTTGQNLPNGVPPAGTTLPSPSNLPAAGVATVALMPNTQARSLIQPGAFEGLGMAGQTLPAAINPLGCSPPFNPQAGLINGQAPNAGQIAQSIQAYANNVKGVSAFLQTAGTNPNDPGIGGNAISARNAENDETNHLNTMCSLGPQMLGQTIFQNSCSALPANYFPEVVADLQNIADGLITGPNPALVTQLVNKMNTNRCANVLPNIQNAWDGSAAAMNVPSQQLIAPVACAQINNNATEFFPVTQSAGVFSTQLTTQPPRMGMAFKKLRFL